jgi:hypothetical protein
LAVISAGTACSSIEWPARCETHEEERGRDDQEQRRDESEQPAQRVVPSMSVITRVLRAALELVLVDDVHAELLGFAQLWPPPRLATSNVVFLTRVETVAPPPGSIARLVLASWTRASW